MLKLQYFGHLIRRAKSLGKTLMLGMIETNRRNQRNEANLTDSMDMNLSKLWEIVCSPWGGRESETP